MMRAAHRADGDRSARVQVFIVVIAIELLDLGDGGVGYLNAAIGIGAFVGAVARSRSPVPSG